MFPEEPQRLACLQRLPYPGWQGDGIADGYPFAAHKASRQLQGSTPLDEGGH